MPLQGPYAVPSPAMRAPGLGALGSLPSAEALGFDMSALRAYHRPSRQGHAKSKHDRPGRDGISKPSVLTLGMAIVKKRVPEVAGAPEGTADEHPCVPIISATRRRTAARVSRLFRINSLDGKCSHVVHKYISYTYPCLPVGLRSHAFRRMFAFQRNQ